MRKDAKKSWIAILTVLALVVTFCLPAASSAQESTGSIEGAVSDPSGAVVAGATVTITSKKTARTISVTTTGTGLFIARALQPGDYEVKVEAAGFKTGVREVTVQVGAAANGDLSLEVGSPTEVVNVQAESSVQVNTVENKVYDVITQRQIENLPLNGRNFLDLAQLSPGVQIVDGGTFDPTKNQFTGISIAGRSGRVTRIQVDGIDISDETVGTTTQNISQDALQEFQLSQSSLDPSTSLTSSGAVNIVTRSGGNDIHGAGFFFYRDEEVAAVPVTFTGIPSIDQNLKSAEFDREQGGFSVGGPFIKEKLFWFVNFEKSNQDATTFTRPTNFPNFAGAVTTPFNENLALGRLDWNVNNNIRTFYRFSHNSNDAATGFGGSANCCAPFANDNNTNVHALGIDVTQGQFSHSGRYGHTNFDNQIVPAMLEGLPVFSAANGVPISIALNTRAELYTGPNRLAPQMTFQNDDQVKYDGGFVRGSHSWRYGAEVNHIQVNLFASFFGIGPEVRATFSEANRNAIIARGGDPLDPLEYPVSFFIVGNGQGSFTEIANLGRPGGGINNTRISWYFQDSWRWRPNFTLNYGVKYGVDTGQVNDDLPGPAFLEQVIGPGQSRPTRLDKNNFGPQVGFAWDFKNDGKTVIRGGGGVFYETQIFNNAIFDRTNRLPVGLGFSTATPPLSSIDDQGRLLVGGQPVSPIDTRTLAGRPIGQVIDQIGELQLAFQAASAALPFDPNGISLLEAAGTTDAAGPIFNQEFASPTAYQINLGIQHELSQGFLVSADYIFNRSTHTNIVRDYNRLHAANTLDPATARIIRDAALASEGFDPGIGGVNQAIADGFGADLFGSIGDAFVGEFPFLNGPISVIVPSGISEYNALQIRLTKRFSSIGSFARNAIFDVNYALSRFNGIAGDQDFLPGTAFNDDFLNPRNFGPTTLDRTHQLSVNAQADLPWGLNISTITALRTALPVTPFLTLGFGGSTEVLFTDLDGDGTFQDILPGAERGSFGRSIGSISELNEIIGSFNGQFAGQITPAGQALVNAGVFTENQLRQLGFIVQPIDPAPAGQVMNDSFITTDIRIAKNINIGERVRILPLVEIFNLFNVSNFAVLSGQLAGSPGQINGTTEGQRSNKLGLGSGSFSQGLARSVQFGLRVSF